MSRALFVYILASDDRKLYVGVTNNLAKRIAQHRSTARSSAFTQRHRITRLVFYETHTPPRLAIVREKQIKAWTRKKRVDLIESLNPEWKDLSEEFWIDR